MGPPAPRLNASRPEPALGDKEMLRVGLQLQLRHPAPSGSPPGGTGRASKTGNPPRARGNAWPRARGPRPPVGKPPPKLGRVLAVAR
eukprot:14913928-Alexandrium_andersonii.AAC.1